MARVESNFPHLPHIDISRFKPRHVPAAVYYVGTPIVGFMVGLGIGGSDIVNRSTADGNAEKGNRLELAISVANPQSKLVPMEAVVPAGVASSRSAQQPSDRTNCDAIRGTDYRSDAEREWFLGNCSLSTQAAVIPSTKSTEQSVGIPSRPSGGVQTNIETTRLQQEPAVVVPEIELSFIAAFNEWRRSLGLSAVLVVDPALQSAARNYAKFLNDNNWLDEPGADPRVLRGQMIEKPHDRLGSAQSRASAAGYKGNVGEVLGTANVFPPRPSWEQIGRTIFEQLKASDGHRALMVRGDIVSIAPGCVYGSTYRRPFYSQPVPMVHCPVMIAVR